MSNSKNFKQTLKQNEIGYDTSRDSIDKKDLSFEDSPKLTYSNIRVIYCVLVKFNKSGNKFK